MRGRGSTHVLVLAFDTSIRSTNNRNVLLVVGAAAAATAVHARGHRLVELRRIPPRQLAAQQGTPLRERVIGACRGRGGAAEVSDESGAASDAGP